MSPAVTCDGLRQFSTPVSCIATARLHPRVSYPALEQDYRIPTTLQLAATETQHFTLLSSPRNHDPTRRELRPNRVRIIGYDSLFGAPDVLDLDDRVSSNPTCTTGPKQRLYSSDTTRFRNLRSCPVHNLPHHYHRCGLHVPLVRVGFREWKRRVHRDEWEASIRSPESPAFPEESSKTSTKNELVDRRTVH